MIKTTSEPDTVELARFRELWKAEVRKRKSPSDFTAEAIPSGKVHENTTVPSNNLRSALQVYSEAIQREQNGDLDDALQLYRQAFRMDSHVDRAYAREEKLAIALASQSPPPKRESAVDQADAQSKNVSSSVIISKGKQVIAASILVQIISAFPPDVRFEPEEEQQPMWLRILPDELLVFVLRQLDITSIERFALICRKARLLSLDATLWRELVVTTYKPPQITQTDDLVNLLDRYTFNYRRIFIEHPRIRLDGVYIAICHYVRPGLSENHWVNISQLVTYHRYLRFFSDGAVLSLLTNEEMNPQQVIPLLKPTLRMKGLYVGTWELLDNAVHLNLVDANERLPDSLSPSFSPLISVFERLGVSDVPHSHKQATLHNAVNSQRTRYMFNMRLDLRSRPLGRWNRLDIESYNSIHLESGDMTPVALKHERPFWFSKVRSYAS
ncbi:hypothetical protein M378DRAFT_1054313 [Amanita muscaria Koide BX008]|uniref:F-box only protein 9 n=1 Tax=Amanita muscaria (strain Koide BX008) TaxID=946122 RepID=A0A0C2TPX4_AMAMK|nr:hypothetical protein M378DRAFT_1054313 [Amanita muscaria Koide BX008]